MKRILMVVLAAALMLAGCASGAPVDGEMVFTDDLGREVRLGGEPGRVACLLGSFADVWFLAGGTVIAAPDDAWEDFSLPMPEDAVVLGSTKHLSLELLLASEPDFVLASANTQLHLQWKETLEAAGIPVAYFEVSDFEDYLRLLKVCTELTGNPECYEQYGLAIEDQIDRAVELAGEQILRSGKAPTVLYLRLAASGIRVKNSRDNVLGEMLRTLGCENIADSDRALLENLSMEQILIRDPDYIFLVPQGDDVEGTRRVLDSFIADHPGWQELTAVKEGRVFTLEKELYSLKPNERWAEAYEKLVELIWG